MVTGLSHLILEMTPARRMKKFNVVRTEKARSQQLSSLMMAVIPVKKMIRDKMPPPVITIGTIRKSMAITSSMWIL